MWEPPHQQQLPAQFATLAISSSLHSSLFSPPGSSYNQEAETDTEFDYQSEVGHLNFPTNGETPPAAAAAAAAAAPQEHEPVHIPPHQPPVNTHTQTFGPDTDFDYQAEVGYPNFAAAPQELDGHLQPFVGLGPGLLGDGSFGAVFTAFHGHRMVAIKVFREMVRDHVPSDAIRQELELQMMCQHEFVVQAYGWKVSPVRPSGHPGGNQGFFCVVMEHCICSLEDKLGQLRMQHYGQNPAAAAQQDEQQGPPPAPPPPPPPGQPGLQPPDPAGSISELSVRLSVMGDVAAAVQHMHGGGLQQQGGERCAVLHNDLRAQNVMLQVNAEGRLVGKVADFGLAARLEGHQEAASIMQPTHPLWVAPEAYWGRRHGPYNVTRYTDIFALGHMFWEVLSGLYPYQRPGEALTAAQVDTRGREWREALQNQEHFMMQPSMKLLPLTLSDGTVGLDLPLPCSVLGCRLMGNLAADLGACFDSCCRHGDFHNGVQGGHQRPTAAALVVLLRGLAQAARDVAAAAAVADAAAAAFAALHVDGAIEQPPSAAGAAGAAEPQAAGAAVAGAAAVAAVAGGAAASGVADAEAVPAVAEAGVLPAVLQGAEGQAEAVEAAVAGAAAVTSAAAVADAAAVAAVAGVADAEVVPAVAGVAQVAGVLPAGQLLQGAEGQAAAAAAAAGAAAVTSAAAVADAAAVTCAAAVADAAAVATVAAVANAAAVATVAAVAVPAAAAPAAAAPAIGQSLLAAVAPPSMSVHSNLQQQQQQQLGDGQTRSIFFENGHPGGTPFWTSAAGSFTAADSASSSCKTWLAAAPEGDVPSIMSSCKTNGTGIFSGKLCTNDTAQVDSVQLDQDQQQQKRQQQQQYQKAGAGACSSGMPCCVGARTTSDSVESLNSFDVTVKGCTAGGVTGHPGGVTGLHGAEAS